MKTRLTFVLLLGILLIPQVPALAFAPDWATEFPELTADFELLGPVKTARIETAGRSLSNGVWVDSPRQLTSIATYRNGKLAEEEWHPHIEQEPPSRRVLTYDAAGRRKQFAEYCDGDLFYSISYQYNPKGKLRNATCTYRGEKLSEETYEYDAKGRLIKEARAGQGQAQGRYTYAADGQLREYNQYDVLSNEPNVPTAFPAYKQRYLYTAGNKTMEIGVIIDSEQHQLCFVQFCFDQRGRVIEEGRYALAGGEKPLRQILSDTDWLVLIKQAKVVSVLSTVYQDDAFGNWVKREEFCKYEDNVVRWSEVAYRTISYDTPAAR